MIKPKVVLLIFVSGKIVLTGAKVNYCSTHSPFRCPNIVAHHRALFSFSSMSCRSERKSTPPSTRSTPCLQSSASLRHHPTNPDGDESSLVPWGLCLLFYNAHSSSSACWCKAIAHLQPPRRLDVFFCLLLLNSSFYLPSAVNRGRALGSHSSSNNHHKATYSFSSSFTHVVHIYTQYRFPFFSPVSFSSVLLGRPVKRSAKSASLSLPPSQSTP